MPAGLFNLMKESPTPECALEQLTPSLAENEFLFPQPSEKELEELKKGPFYTGLSFVSPDGRKMRLAISRKELDPSQTTGAVDRKKDPSLFLFNRPLIGISFSAWEHAFYHFRVHNKPLPADEGVACSAESILIPSKAISH